MKFLIKLLIFLGAVLLALHFFFNVNLDDFKRITKLPTKSVCDDPVTYKIGTIDPRFNINEDFIKEKLEEAEKIWELAYGKDLFTYDPDSKLEINFIYDERQENLDAIVNNETSIVNATASVEEQNTAYEQKVEELEKQIEDLNKQIDYWNSKGGAPEAEFNYLTKMQEDLNKKVEELNTYADNLNKVVNEVNKNINSFNKTVSKFNDMIIERPEVGIYTSGEEKIDIYFFSDDTNLVNTLAHEFGHSLGLGHIEVKGAIMNPIMSENTKLSDADIELLRNYCNEHTYISKFKEKVKLYLDLFISRIISFDPIENTNIEDQTDDPQGNKSGYYKVVNVVDGDTIKVDFNGEVTTVRFIGIDTPEVNHPTEPVQCFGEEASQNTKDLLENKTVKLEQDVSETDRYGRILAYVWIDDVLINEQIVREGYAFSSPYPPDVKYQDKLDAAEAYARENNMGLWSKNTCNGDVYAGVTK